jgi:putative N-acetylmannosamine-6-phosphate epimerase
MSQTLRLRQRGLIVSSQAIAGSPLRDSNALVRIGIDALIGGASALRLAGAEVVKLAKTFTDAPIIGIIKTEREGFEPRITAIVNEIEVLKDAGADIVGIDSTNRRRPEPIEHLYKRARDLQIEIFADIATLEEAKRARDLGADYVATTLAGYTRDRASTVGPDLDLLESMTSLGMLVVAEGRFTTSKQIQDAFEIGVHSVVIGRAITSPQTIVRQLLSEIS